MKYLYCIENKVSGKKYIGVTIDPERRWKQHTNPKVKKNSAVKDAINKYGKDQFTFTILDFDKDEIIDKKEVDTIAELNTQVPYGYNLTLGGDGATYKVWNDEWNKLLGTMTDKDLGDKLGWSGANITSRRKGLGITSFAESQRCNWSKWDHLLGKITDEALADLAEVCSSTVENRRNKLNIPSKSPTKVRYIYPDELISLLGKETDVDLSKMFDIPKTAITQKRISLGIEKAKLRQGWRKIEWDENQLKVLLDKNITLKEASSIVGASETTVGRFRKEKGVKYIGLDKNGKVNYIPFEGEFLEDMLNPERTNAYISEKYGIKKGTVHYKRNCKKFLKIKERYLNE